MEPYHRCLQWYNVSYKKVCTYFLKKVFQEERACTLAVYMRTCTKHRLIVYSTLQHCLSSVLLVFNEILTAGHLPPSVKLLRIMLTGTFTILINKSVYDDICHVGGYSKIIMIICFLLQRHKM